MRSIPQALSPHCSDKSGCVVEVFASVETGTGTITVALPNGTTCRVASGEALEVLAKTPGPGGTTSQVSASKISFAPVAVKRT